MRSPGINGEGELWGRLANPGSPGKMAIKPECVYMWIAVITLEPGRPGEFLGVVSIVIPVLDRITLRYWIVMLWMRFIDTVLLHCTLSLQCIVIGPVCLGMCLWACLFVCGSVTTITRNCVHQSSPNWVCR